MSRATLLAAIASAAWAWGAFPVAALTFYAPRSAGDLAFGALAGTANTEAWALVPEPASWAIVLLGLGGVGASLRARRRLLLGRGERKITDRR